MRLKTLLLILIVGVFPSFAFSFSCPIKVAEVNQRIWELDQTKYKTIMEVARMLRIASEEAHRIGDHQLAEDLLNSTLRLLDM